MNKLKKLLGIILPILLLTSCTLFQKKEPHKIEKLEKDVIEVEKKTITNKVNIKSATFSSDLVMDKLSEESKGIYQSTSINNLTQIENLDFDIAIVPAYQVVDLYNKTKENIKLSAITTVNNLHIIGDKQISNPKDMAGKRLDKLIDTKLGFLKGLMRISTETYSSQKDLLKNLDESENVIAILSEPYYSKAIEDKSYYEFDINELISMIPNSSVDSKGDFLSDVIIVNKNYLKDNKESFDRFLATYKQAQKSIDENIILSQKLINKYDVTNEEVVKIYNSMDNTFIDSDTMVGVFEIYMDKLEALDKNIFQGKRPTDDLYYKK